MSSKSVSTRSLLSSIKYLGVFIKISLLILRTQPYFRGSPTTHKCGLRREVARLSVRRFILEHFGVWIFDHVSIL